MGKFSKCKPIIYLNLERNFLVVNRAKEAMGRTIKRMARNTIRINDNVTFSRTKKQIEVSTIQYITAKKAAHP